MTSAMFFFFFQCILPVQLCYVYRYYYDLRHVMNILHISQNRKSKPEILEETPRHVIFCLVMCLKRCEGRGDQLDASGVYWLG